MMQDVKIVSHVLCCLSSGSGHWLHYILCTPTPPVPVDQHYTDLVQAQHQYSLWDSSAHPEEDRQLQGAHQEAA